MQYILRIVFVFFTTFIVASLVYALFNIGQAAYRNNYKKHKEMFVDSTKYDVLLVGSSRAYKNIDPIICDSITELSFYNAGVAGAKFYEISMIFSAYFNTHRVVPKYIVYNLDELNFSTDKNFFNPTLYFDFLDNPEIYKGFKYKKYPVWLYKYIPFTRALEYNDDLRNNALKGLLGHVNLEDITVKGYSKMTHDNFKKLATNNPRPIKLGTYKNNTFFNSIITFCKKNNIKLIFVISPVYDSYYKKSISNYDEVVDDFQTFTDNNNYSFWRFDTIPVCYSKKYFADDTHLNKNGTDVFSTILAKKIKEFIKLRK